LVAAGLLVGWVAFGVAQADEIHLTNGGMLEGDATREGEIYRVLLSSGVEMELPASEVLRVVEAPSIRGEYEARLRELEITDAAGHYRLGLLAQEGGLRKEALERFAHCVRVDKDHEGARAALGHVYYDGRWMPQAEAYGLQGLVPHGDRWVTPAEKAELDAAAHKRSVRARLLKLARTVRQDGPSSERTEAAFAGIREAKDPAALETLIELADHWHANVRGAVAIALRHHAGGKGVVRAVTRLAALDEDHDVRALATASIREAKMADAGERLIDMYVKETRAWARNASAYALGKARYKPAIPILTRTLTFTVKRAQLVPSPSGAFVRPKRDRVRRDRWRVIESTRALERYDLRVVDDIGFNDAARESLALLVGRDFDFDSHAYAAWWRDHAASYDPFMNEIPPPAAVPPRSP
jgi:hypothetical protein